MAILEILGSLIIGKALLDQSNENAALREKAIKEHQPTYYDASGFERSTWNKKRVFTTPVCYGFEAVKDAKTGKQLSIHPLYPELTLSDYGKTDEELKRLHSERKTAAKTKHFKTHGPREIEEYLERPEVQQLVEEKKAQGFNCILWPVEKYSKTYFLPVLLNFETKKLLSNFLWMGTKFTTVMFDGTSVRDGYGNSESIDLTILEEWKTGYLRLWEEYDHTYWDTILPYEKALYRDYYKGNKELYLHDLRERNDPFAVPSRRWNREYFLVKWAEENVCN